MTAHDLDALVEQGRRIMSSCADIQDTTGLADEFPIDERRALAEELSSEYHSTFLEKNPCKNNVFLMMKYRDSNQNLADMIRSGVENAGLKLWLAEDVRITDELATNVFTVVGFARIP